MFMKKKKKVMTPAIYPAMTPATTLAVKVTGIRPGDVRIERQKCSKPIQPPEKSCGTYLLKHLFEIISDQVKITKPADLEADSLRWTALERIIWQTNLSYTTQ